MSSNLWKAAFFIFLILSLVEAGVIADYHLKLKAQGFLTQSLTDLSIENSAAELVKLKNIDCSRPYTGSNPDFLESLIEIQRESTEKYLKDISLPPRTREILEAAISHSCACCKNT